METLKKYFLHIIIVISLSIFFIHSCVQKQKLKNNHKETQGIITGYHFSNNSYDLDYTFEIDSINYKGSILVSKFDCDSIPFCVGNYFKVYYSPKNPNNNILDLGIYRRFQHNPPNW